MTNTNTNTNTDQPHPNAEVIIAWAQGRAIQCKSSTDEPWRDVTNSEDFVVLVTRMYHREWRIKPEQKTGWIVVIDSTQYDDEAYVGNTIYETRELAYTRSAHLNVRAIIQITYTEGEGL